MSSSRIVTDVATGLLAGWAATQVKAKAESALQGWGEQVLPPRPGQKELPGADPAGRGERMPPSLLYRRLVVLVRGRAGGEILQDDQVEAGAVWLHRLMGYGYAVGYALVSRRAPLVRAGAGSVGGAALFGAFHGTALPAVGVQAPASELPRAWWVWEGGSHVAYGLAVDLVVSTVRRLTR